MPCLFLHALPGCGRDRRQPAIRWIDDERGAEVLAHAAAPVPPERVVRAFDVDARDADALIDIEEAELALRERARLLGSKELLAGELRRALERREGTEVPDAVDAGRAPRRARRLVGAGVEQRDDGRDRTEQRGERSSARHVRRSFRGRSTASIDPVRDDMITDGK